ncbi:hypothetical protein GOBAR_DD36988 [Gossypium barbadense]|nr:hypothetical protein GOBAR_DD36988 [Gossypium barbadense]
MGARDLHLSYYKICLPFPRFGFIQKELNLRDYNLFDIPNDICCLCSLKELDLSGNNFISIPSSLTRLSKLQYLGLSNCKELKSLPELLTRSEIPKWFSQQRGGSSIKIHLPTNIRNDSQWMGVAFCCIFVSDDTSRDENVMCKAVIQGRNPRVVDWCGLLVGKKSGQPIIKDHIFPRYWSPDILYPFSLENECSERETKNLSTSDCSNQEFDELEMSMTSFCGPLVKVKKCGVRIVYEKDVEEMEQIKKKRSSQCFATFEDIHQLSADYGSIGSISLVKRKRNIYEETEEGPLPKRMKQIFNFILS